MQLHGIPQRPIKFILRKFKNSFRYVPACNLLLIEMGPETPVGKKAAELKPQLMEGIAKEMQKQNLEAKKKADESKKK